MFNGVEEFSFRTRQTSLKRLQGEVFDLLVIGGGITGAAVAHEAAQRGLTVALVDQGDFACGTSSNSSKLIHGGLRYLENMELGLVYEALAERSFLLKSAPQLVKPLPFILPVYRGDAHGKAILSLGLWLYDLLALFRSPRFHRGLSRSELLRKIPFLKEQDLRGGFEYSDASMWDDVLTVETLKAAHRSSAAVMNYCQAVTPLWKRDLVSGFRVRNKIGPRFEEIDVRAHRVVACTGPWTDQMGRLLDPQWKNWLRVSKGVHLVFDLKRVPVPAALVMSHPDDGRISFVIPRQEFGSGVVIVGTTDSSAPLDPQDVKVETEDVHYLLALLNRYFPDLKLNASDILSAYVGVRPLVDNEEGATLQKVSREHHIGEGPGGTVLVAGGKYTTHRKMAQEILEKTLSIWKRDLKAGRTSVAIPSMKPPIGSTQSFFLNPAFSKKALAHAQQQVSDSTGFPTELWSRYGAEALGIWKSHQSQPLPSDDPEGFPFIEAQFRHAIHAQMAMQLPDFFLRRSPLFLSRKDHGMPWAARLARIWSQELRRPREEEEVQISLLEAEIQKRMSWFDQLSPAGLNDASSDRVAESSFR